MRLRPACATQQVRKQGETGRGREGGKEKEGLFSPLPTHLESTPVTKDMYNDTWRSFHWHGVRLLSISEWAVSWASRREKTRRQQELPKLVDRAEKTGSPDHSSQLVLCPRGAWGEDMLCTHASIYALPKTCCGSHGNRTTLQIQSSGPEFV